MKLSLGDKIIDVVIIVLLVVFAVSIIYPFYFAFLYSIEGVNATAEGMAKYFVPRQFSTFAYNFVFKDKTLYKAFMVTAARTLLGTVVSVFFTAMFAYALSKQKLMFRKVYLKMGVITMYFGAGLIPFYMLLSTLKLLNTFWVYIFPNMLSFFNAILYITFFSELPAALEESAWIDGANDFYIFWKIIVPLSTPVIATISLFNGVFHWNAWFDAAYYVNNADLQTLQSVLWKLVAENKAVAELAKYTTGEQRSQSQLDAVKFATMIVSMIPITFAYPFLQKYFVKGMMIGSVKG